MPRSIQEYRCLLISPADLTNEREAVKNLIARWNAEIGGLFSTRIEAVGWELDAVPDAAAPAQTVLNRQIVDSADFGIALFWTRLGTPTQHGRSGSVEEIERLLAKNARVLVYFSSAPIAPSLVNSEQLA